MFFVWWTNIENSFVDFPAEATCSRLRFSRLANKSFDLILTSHIIRTAPEINRWGN